MEAPLSARKNKLTPRRPRQHSLSSEDNNNNNSSHEHNNNNSGEAGNGDTKLLSPVLESNGGNAIANADDYDYSDIGQAHSKEEKIHASSASCLPEEKRRVVLQKCTEVQQQVPLAQKCLDLINRCPPKLRWILLSIWLLWKVVLALIFLHMLLFTTTTLSNAASSEDTTTTQRFTREIGAAGGYNNNNNGGKDSSSTRILYVVTTLAEFNTGQRQTEKGQDRLGEVLIPILVDSVESMVHEPFNYHVDVFLISAFTLRPERDQYIRERLPDGVGFENWSDAMPLGYEVKHSPDKVIDNTRALARQHRYVIKDKLPYYDLFVAFEDDMRLTGDHVSHFLEMSDEIDQLRLDAPASVPGQVPENMEPKSMRFFGPMTSGQLDRVIPGFIRVEVLLNEKEHGAQQKLDNIDTDFTFEVSTKGGAVQQKQKHFDPRICCHVHMMPNKDTPNHPKPQDVVIWETNVKAMSVRKMPTPKVGEPSTILDWVAVLPGPGKHLHAKFNVGGYWSGRDGAFGDEEKPSGGRPDIIAQQGGWMATRSQILRMHDLCMGAFVPPFDKPMYNNDGQESFNVEFWSGGYQFFTGVRGGCNMQRIISLHPDHFSKHFIYHVANNKQRQLNNERMLRADNFLAQLNTVRKTAEKALPKDL